MPNLSSSLAALVLAAATTGALAAEPGDASVRSYIGQPLVADIELTDLTPQDLADLQVRMARADVFEGANVKMHPALAGANLSVVRRDGRRVLHVTTTAPVQAEVLHLFFQLSAGGKDRTRSVTLWLSPDPTPPVRVAATPLVAVAAPGKDTSASELQLMSTVERAFAARAPKVDKPAPKKVTRPILTAEMIRKAAMEHSSSADDFRRAAPVPKPAVAAREVAKAPVKEAKPAVAAKEPPAESKPASRLKLASREELAEAARATRAGVEHAGEAKSAVPATGKAEAAKPATTVAAVAAVAKQDDAAMLKKLAELETKLKTLQAMVGEGAAPAATKDTGRAPAGAPAPNAGDQATMAAAASTKPPAAGPVKVSMPVKAGAPEIVKAVAAAPVQAAAAAVMPAPALAAPHPPVQAAAAKPEGHDELAGHAPAEKPDAAAAPQAEAKPKEEPKAAEPPPPEPEKKEIKISRPKILTFLFAASLVLLVIFGIIVHFIRKAKNKRSPIVRQSWSRDDDDDAPRTEPTVAPVVEEQKAA